MYIKRIAFLLFALTTIILSCKSQEIKLTNYKLPIKLKNTALYKLDSSSLFNEKQNIVVVEVKKKAFHGHTFEIAFSDSALLKTSQFGLENHAKIALNGSFFDVSKGGSVAYLESNGQVIARNRKYKEKWAKSDSLLNGAIVVDPRGRLIIEKAKNESYYEKSDKEKAVLVSGPILLVDGQKVSLENSEFVKKRHPRTCLCETSGKSILFIAIDGRTETASGMNLYETQEFLLRLKCLNAINLDGGGSTALWINDGHEKGILNNPSDKAGERPVANIILYK